VVSVYTLAFRGAMPLGNLVAGSLASFFSAPTVLVANGAVMILVGAITIASRRAVLEL